MYAGAGLAPEHDFSYTKLYKYVKQKHATTLEGLRKAITKT